MLTTIILALGLSLGNPSEGVETYNVKVKESTIKWEGNKVGGSHTGTIDLKEGGLILEDGFIKGGSFEIDMTSIANEDLTGDYKAKLEGHLKSDDFFGVETFPTATFEITNAIPQGPDKYKIEGEITIKGITKQIKFPATVTGKGETLEASAEITVDRSDFDVKYGSGSFFDNLGDKVIYDDFILQVSLVASK